MNRANDASSFLRHVVQWAERQPDIVALIMTGSRARTEGKPDEFSDYDLEVFTTDPERYTSNIDWTAGIARVWVYLPLTSKSRGCPTRLVVFDDARKVDFSILPTRALQEMVDSPKLNALYERGYAVLLDRSGATSSLPRPSGSPPVRPTPTEAEFRAAVDEFWFEAFHIPTYLRRGDLWVVKFRDWTMKQLLLRMLEWHATATTTDPPDIWHIGAHMTEWTQPDIWQRLHGIFASFDAHRAGRRYRPPPRCSGRWPPPRQNGSAIATLRKSTTRLVDT